VEAGQYRRTISLNGSHGYFEISLDEPANALVARVEFDDPRSLFFITERIRAMFDLNADWGTIVQSFMTDPALASRVQANPGLRVPGCWNGFELAVRAILGQQVSVKGASTLAGRLAKTFGQAYSGPSGLSHIFPIPKVLVDANIREIGLPLARAETIRAVARAVHDRRLSFESAADSSATLSRFCELPGIGQWTAQYVAMRALGEPDAFPSSDLGLLRSLGLTSVRELERRADAWRPWRAYAAMHLWSAAVEPPLSSKPSKSRRSNSALTGVNFAETVSAI
jgi:AraC family transcriptional regulator of adaptative response / DNA-3-methyladenine glycosylase II